MSTWQKLQGRPESFPCFVYSTEANSIRAFFTGNEWEQMVDWSGKDGHGWSHWVPSDLPEPPKEQTQAEKDYEAVQDIWNDSWDGGSSTVDFGLAVLAWERAEVEKLLPEPVSATSAAYIASVCAIRARCAGGAKP